MRSLVLLQVFGRWRSLPSLRLRIDNSVVVWLGREGVEAVQARLWEAVPEAAGIRVELSAEHLSVKLGPDPPDIAGWSRANGYRTQPTSSAAAPGCGRECMASLIACNAKLVGAPVRSSTPFVVWRSV